MLRQVDPDRGAPADLAVDPDMPLRLIGEAIDHREAQSGALADRLGGEERVEGLGEQVRQHTGSGVGHADRHISAGRAAAMGGRVGVVEMYVCGFDEEPAPVRHGVTGIDRQVGNGAFELVGIAARGSWGNSAWTVGRLDQCHWRPLLSAADTFERGSGGTRSRLRSSAD